MKIRKFTPLIAALLFIAIVSAMINPVSAIVVDGIASPGEWTIDMLEKEDPWGNEENVAIYGYDLRALYAYYDEGNNIMYWRLDVEGIPGDIDGNSDTDTDCGFPPSGYGDCNGVGPYEHYTVVLHNGGPDIILRYNNNDVSHADADADFGTIVEFSLNNADNYINPNDYCLTVSAGGDYDIPGEDIMNVCIFKVLNGEDGDEFWAVEWFETLPHQYTQFNLPEDQKYLTTLSWFADESIIHNWDGLSEDEPISAYEGERVKFIHDPRNERDDIYFDPEARTVRVYGTFGEGPGDHEIKDPETNFKPENPPYTDPVGPFYPQSEQAPVKDHIVFNPAIMDHNDREFTWYSQLDFGTNYEGQKVFKRMSYEKDWFKDHNTNGCFDVVFSRYNEDTERDEYQVICLDNKDAVHDALADGWVPEEHNNDPTVNGQTADIYGPAIIQDFTYMFLEDNMPIPVVSGSTVLIPMASYVNGNGIDCFGPKSANTPVGVQVESEQTLGLDIDGDGGALEPMDADGKNLSADETVVLVLRNQYLPASGGELQFFDHKVKVLDVFDTNKAVFRVSDNEGPYYNQESIVTLGEGEVAYFYRAKEGGSPTEAPAFYLKVVTADSVNDRAIFEVGRMFGQVSANIAANKYHSQKAFWVDEVFYNVVAIKAYPDNKVKYITFRQKLPKEPIKLHDNLMAVWNPGDVLPEMPPFNMYHKVHDDIQDDWSHVKMGSIKPADPLVVRYLYEDHEDRFKGELKEIYNETANREFWMLEWFMTLPWQYTEFNIKPRYSGELWLLTSAFYSPESCIHMWDGDEDQGPMFSKEGERVKFWFDMYYNPLYIDDGELRIFGTFGEGPGDHDFVDPVTNLKPENPPYTDPTGPLNPQSDQAPVKDHVTFNPAIMDHNDPEFNWYSRLDFGINYEAQKVFKRMSYEKEWFKDHNTNGRFDVVFKRDSEKQLISLDDTDAVHAALADGWEMLPHNNDRTINGQLADIYGPAIIQEFTYMFLNDIMPTPIQSGSTVLIPMASYENGNGIDSFGPKSEDTPMGVQVESEATLNLDIDGDGVFEPMDADGVPLSGDETVVLVLRNQYLAARGGELQFFDHKVKVMDVFDTHKAIVKVSDNEGPYYNQESTVTLGDGEVAYFYRAKEGGSQTEAPAFYLKLVTADSVNDRAIFEVGRMFGQPGANLAANKYHSQKAFWVDEVFYNVVAIRAYTDNEIKYVTFRQKLPKEEVKIHDMVMAVWTPHEILPEMPPFNMRHRIHEDVQMGWTWPPIGPEDKIGPDRVVGPLEINYTVESIETRFTGELKEIYWETGIDEGPLAKCPCDLTGDRLVNIDDVKELIANWGSSGTSDFNDDGTTNIEDVKILIANWGTCPT